MRRLGTLFLALGIATHGPAQKAPTLEVRTSISPPFPVAALLTEDLDGDRKADLLLVGEAGEVRTWSRGEGKLLGTLTLPHPTRSLIALATLQATGKQLVVFAPEGVFAYRQAGGVFAGPPHRLLPRGRFTLRVGSPSVAPIVQDVNGDGRSDLVLPAATHCEVWLNRAGDKNAEWPEFAFASRVPIAGESSFATRGKALTDVLASRVHIPAMRTEDLNGDGRADLIADQGERRSFHLQRPGGDYPQKPDAVLDLSTFRDTTPKAEFKLGRTLALDQATVRMQDLSGDGIPDFVIHHRRKLWVFHGTAKGPQFVEPATILVLAQDVSFVLLMHLDEDRHPDLLLFRLGVPSIATLLAGLLASWDVELEAIGYRNDGGRTFAKTPAWTSTTTLRLPSILGLLKNPESLVSRFKEVGNKYRAAEQADLDSDGGTDVLMQTEDGASLRFWLLGGGSQKDERDGDREMRALLFEDRNRVWDVDRVLAFLRQQGEARTTRVTRGRNPSGTFSLRDQKSVNLLQMQAVDLMDDGRDEVLLHYRYRTAPRRSVLDILGLRR